MTSTIDRFAPVGHLDVSRPSKRRRNNTTSTAINEWMAPVVVPTNSNIQISAAFRLRAVKLLYKQLGDMVCAREVERHIFVGTLAHGFGYAPKVTQIVGSLQLNPSIAQTYSPEVLVLLDDKTLSKGTAVEEWWLDHDRRLEHQRQVLSERQEYERDEQQEGSGGKKNGMVCWKCHSKTINIDLKQTRSADEPMSAFCECGDCGARWKM